MYVWKKLQNNSKLLANIDVETNIDKTSIIKQNKPNFEAQDYI